MYGEMARTESCKIRLQATSICCFFLLPLAFALGACSFPVHPRYQPISESGGLSRPVQGYQDIQIDGETYFITYMNYYGFSFGHGLPGDPRDDKWLKGAQEYVLYRAAELAQSKGAQYFAVLYQDDWNLSRVERGYYKWRGVDPHWEPGAGLVMRVLSNYPSSMPPNNNRVYEVGMLLQSLIEKNSGLAEYQKKTVHDEPAKTAGDRFIRWRLSVSGYDSVPVPGTRQTTFIGQEYIKFKPGSAIIPQTPDQFEIAIWDDKLISPLQLLSECVKLADQRRYEVFKLMNWTVDEYRNDDTHYREGGWKVWFRTKATIVLQHQNEPDTPDPVFVVDEIRSNVMNNKNRR